jgi:hypothetical protein
MFEIAMKAQLSYTRLKDAIFAYPTLADSLNKLFMAMVLNSSAAILWYSNMAALSTTGDDSPSKSYDPSID